MSTFIIMSFFVSSRQSLSFYGHIFFVWLRTHQLRHVRCRRFEAALLWDTIPSDGFMKPLQFDVNSRVMSSSSFAASAGGEVAATYVAAQICPSYVGHSDYPGSGLSVGTSSCQFEVWQIGKLTKLGPRTLSCIARPKVRIILLHLGPPKWAVERSAWPSSSFIRVEVICSTEIRTCWLIVRSRPRPINWRTVKTLDVWIGL